MTGEKRDWKAGLGAFIPQYVPNCIVAGGMELLSILNRTPSYKIAENKIQNKSILVQQEEATQMSGFFCQGTYIENQRQWKMVKFGKDYTMSYGGCEIFATYNALLNLGKKLTVCELVDLISYFERHGAVWAGRLGIAPQSVYRYFRKQGYGVQKTWSQKEEIINFYGQKSDTLIVTTYNNEKNVFDYIHTVNISKDKEGKFHAHNDYRSHRNGQGETVFVSHGPYDTLFQAISNLSKGNSKPICIIGIRNQ